MRGAALMSHRIVPGTNVVIWMTNRCDICGIKFFGKYTDWECGLCE